VLDSYLKNKDVRGALFRQSAKKTAAGVCAEELQQVLAAL